MNSEKLDVFEIKNEKLTFFHLQKKKRKRKKDNGDVVQLAEGFPSMHEVYISVSTTTYTGCWDTCL